MKRDWKKFLLALLSVATLAACSSGGDSGGFFVGAGAPPIATVSAASSITENTAILNGNVIPNGVATQAWFEYGTNSSLSTYASTAEQSIGDGLTAVPVLQSVSGLTGSVTYYFRVCGKNSKGTTKSTITSFATASPGAAPTVSTLVATGVSATGATLNGNVIPNGSATNVWFEYGTDPALATSSSTTTQSAGSGTTSQLISASLTGLTTGTKYYFRIAASNSIGTTRGAISAFLPGAAPTATTLAPTSVSTTGFTLNGSVIPNGLATTIWFEWGTDSALSSYDNTAAQDVGSGTVSVNVNDNLAGLVPGTTYYFRIASQNSSGTSRGSINSCTTFSQAGLPFPANSQGRSISMSRTGDGSLYLAGNWYEGTNPPFTYTSFVYRVKNTGELIWSKTEPSPQALVVRSMTNGGATAVFRNEFSPSSLVIARYDETGEPLGAGRQEINLGSGGSYVPLAADVGDDGTVFAVVLYSPPDPALPEVFVQPVDPSGNLLVPSEVLDFTFNYSFSIRVTPTDIFVSGIKESGGPGKPQIQIARMTNTGSGLGSNAPPTYPPVPIGNTLPDALGTSISIAATGTGLWVSAASFTTGKGYLIGLDNQLVEVVQPIELAIPPVSGTTLRDETRAIEVDASGNILIGVTRIAPVNVGPWPGAANHLTVFDSVTLSQTQYPILYNYSGFSAEHVLNPSNGRSVEGFVTTADGGYLYGWDVVNGEASSKAILIRLGPSYAPLL